MRAPHALIICSCLAVLAASGVARAQSVAQPGQAVSAGPIDLGTYGLPTAEGYGVKLGENLIFHPALSVDARYDSNIFYSDSRRRAAFVFHAAPALTLATPSALRGGGQPHKLDFSFRAAADYREYLTSDPAIKNQRGVAAEAGLSLLINPGGVVTFGLTDDFTRAIDPPFTGGSEPLTRDSNQASAELTVRPGGGRLELVGWYGFSFNLWETMDLRNDNLIYHSVAFRARWLWLPKTAIQLEYTQDFRDYFNADYAAEGHRKINSMPLRATASLIGLITPKLSLRLGAGYGNGFYDAGPSFNGPVGIAVIRFRFSTLSQLALQYQYDFADVLFFNYYSQHAVSLDFQQALGSRFILALDARYAYRNYAGSLIQNATSVKRVENWVAADAGFSVLIQKWLQATAFYNFELSRANQTLAVRGQIVYPNYTKHVVGLRLTASY